MVSGGTVRARARVNPFSAGVRDSLGCARVEHLRNWLMWEAEKKGVVPDEIPADGIPAACGGCALHVPTPGRTPVFCHAAQRMIPPPGAGDFNARRAEWCPLFFDAGKGFTVDRCRVAENWEQKK